MSVDSTHLRLGKGVEVLPHARHRVAKAAAVVSQKDAEGNARDGALVHQALTILADGHRDGAGWEPTPGTAQSATTTTGTSKLPYQVGDAHVAELRERAQSEARVGKRATEIAAAAQAAEHTMEQELAQTERELSSLQSELGVHPHGEDTIYAVFEEPYDEHADNDRHVQSEQSDDDEDQEVFAAATLSARGMEAFEGELTVHIIDAANLKDPHRVLHTLHMNKPLSSYVSVAVGSETRHTRVDKDAGPNPKWHEKLPFQVTKRTAPVMRLKMLSWSTRGADMVIGECAIDLTGVASLAAMTDGSTKPYHRVAEIRGPTHGSVHGTVNVEISLVREAGLAQHRVNRAGHSCESEGHEDAVDDGAEDMHALASGRVRATTTIIRDGPLNAHLHIVRTDHHGEKRVDSIQIPRRLSDVHFADRSFQHGGGGGTMEARTHNGTEFRLGTDVETHAHDALEALYDVNTGALFRQLVSKKKRRFREDGFDLDLTYITDQIIAMGFPSDWSDMEALYRNPIDEVVRLLSSRHRDKFLVVNLCSERSYDPVIFEREGGVVLQLGFDDHNPPPLEMMQPFCHTVGSFLKEDPERVAAIHCKAGKGRTGTMIACLLLYLNEFCTADDALRWFGYCRTSNGKGVTIPSQARYVHYFEQLLYPKVAKQLLKVVPTVVRRQTAWLHSIHVHTVPHFDPDGGCDLYFEVKQRVEPNHRSARDYGVVPRHKKGLKNPEIWFELTPPMELTGDVKLVFYDKDMASSEKVCCCWLHVGMEPDMVVITKSEMDGAVKDKHFKHFDADFRAEILLSDSRDAATMMRSDTGKGFVKVVQH